MECAAAEYTAMGPVSATLHTPALAVTRVSTADFLNATPGQRGTDIPISDSEGLATAQGRAVLHTPSSALHPPRASQDWPPGELATLPSSHMAGP